MQIFQLCKYFFKAEKVLKELQHFEKENSFERTYGWAWLLKLFDELQTNQIGN